jgi:hypothetical protein
VTTPSTFRNDIAAGLLTILQGFAVANPTLVHSTFRSRPPSLDVDLPTAFVETRPETVAHANGIRTRTMNPSVTFVDRLTDNNETMTRMDVLVDAAMDYFTANPHITPSTVWDALTTTDLSLNDGGSMFLAVTFTFGNISIIEGRT